MQHITSKSYNVRVYTQARYSLSLLRAWITAIWIIAIPLRKHFVLSRKGKYLKQIYYVLSSSCTIHNYTHHVLHITIKTEDENQDTDRIEKIPNTYTYVPIRWRNRQLVIFDYYSSFGQIMNQLPESALNALQCEFSHHYSNSTASHSDAFTITKMITLIILHDKCSSPGIRGSEKSLRYQII